MAKCDIKPEVIIAKTDSETLANISRNREAVRKNGDRAVEKKAKGISKSVRRMTVSYVSTRHYDRKTERTRRYTRSASLRLNGHWMEEAGFTTGTPLDVRVMPGCLVITTRPEETSFMKDLNKISRLPEKEQEQVRRFLTGVAAKVVLEAV
ncbi:SymE family type I addiction module toxin [Lelliottia wanjuensis]|uniref:SymE family type I addiction module toxin n=1 Tax=Lelliottia wanjuensis TaxID=3050585 RepID=A0AAP4D0B3_9ENTR|nr:MULTISPECIES: SymE family type I addiction module toxin [unclassified Lelliottia]MDK9361628.1 SymE family type I addiction module toxin [Lelliottia sp. V106_12]MDK9583212.1 SymE family type I addiction module toxin [Lelliottia sp. V86_10]MDK9619734.1 SymE family type I addiction module toxin [Lelliottia sp. V106_9]